LTTGVYITAQLERLHDLHSLTVVGGCPAVWLKQMETWNICF